MCTWIVCICVDMCISTYQHINTHMCWYVYMNCMYLCWYVYMNIPTHMYTYVFICVYELYVSGKSICWILSSFSWILSLFSEYFFSFSEYLFPFSEYYFPIPVDTCVCCQHICVDMGWLRLAGSVKLYVSFAKEPYKRDYILQKRPIILRSLLIVATT